MIDQIEYHLKSLKSTEKYMIYFVILSFFGFIFYYFIYKDFENDMNVLLLNKMSISQKTSSIKKLIKEKSLPVIQKENILRSKKVSLIENNISVIRKKINKVEKFNLDGLKKEYRYLVDGNVSTLFIVDSLPKVLSIIDDINQNYKINHFLLEAKVDKGMLATVSIGDKMINISRKQELLSLESPFFNINNIFNLTSIIDDTARVNGKWYKVDDNITADMKVVDVTIDSVTVSDSKNRYKKFFLNK